MSRLEIFSITSPNTFDRSPSVRSFICAPEQNNMMVKKRRLWIIVTHRSPDRDSIVVIWLCRFIHVKEFSARKLNTIQICLTHRLSDELREDSCDSHIRPKDYFSRRTSVPAVTYCNICL